MDLVGYSHVRFYFFKEVELLYFFHGKLSVRVKLLVVNQNTLVRIPVPAEVH